MQIIKENSYGGSIHTRNDGDGFDVYFLYNMGNPTNDYSNGDVWERKTYKTEKMAVNKIQKWIESNA